MAKKVKQIEGIKVLYHHNAGMIFTGLFAFVLVACTVLSLFFPFVTITDKTNDAIYESKALAMFTSIAFWDPNNFGVLGQVGNPLYTFASETCGSINPYVPLIAQWVLFAACVVMLLAAIFDVLLAFAGLWFILVGKSHHLKFIKVCATFSCVFHVLNTLFLLAYFLVINFLCGNSLDFFYDGLWSYIYAGSSILATIIISIIYNVSFRNAIWSNEIPELQRQLGQNGQSHKENDVSPELIHQEIRETPVLKENVMKGLPSRLSHIGGHAFSYNQYLEIAAIPEGITSIGIGAFSNCGKLSIVSIPRSVKVIHSNAFFNTPALKRISYGGTKEQWRHVRRGSNWLSKSGTCKIVCSDGAIIVNPLH